MNRRDFLFRTSAIGALIAGSGLGAGASERKPNILLIYADDVGYGDLGCYGATRVSTPNIDRIAGGGVRFTNAHSGSATCTPSRYALLTGQYAWRMPGTGILPGDAALIIKPGRVTLPGMLKQQGYRTGVVGKWHLGMGSGNVDWNADIKPGPLEIGFDYSFVIPATPDRVPCVFVENHRVVNLDPQDPIEVSYKRLFAGEATGKEHPELLKVQPSHGHDQAIVNGVSRIGYMTAGDQRFGQTRQSWMFSLPKPAPSLSSQPRTDQGRSRSSCTMPLTTSMSRGCPTPGSLAKRVWARAVMPLLNWTGRSGRL